MQTGLPQRILIVRLSAIGDVVFASPLIAAVHRTYPDAQISWLVEPAQAPLLEAHSLIHEVICWPKGDWQQDFRRRRLWSLSRRVLNFRRRLRDQRFDLVIDVQGLFKSAVLTWLTGAPHRIGFVSKEPTGWLMTRRVTKDTGPRIGSEYLGMAEALGLDVGDFRMDLALLDSDRDFARRVAASGDYIAVAPFTTRPQKHWPIAHWQQLLEQLASEHRRILVLGGPADAERAQQLMVDGSVESFAGRATLTQSAALIAEAVALVGVDTGLTHMGVAFNVPTVALFGSTCPYRETTRANAQVIYHALDCSPCRRNPTCQGRFDCLWGILPNEVVDALEEVLTNG